MKAAVYAVNHKGIWSVRISVDLQIDIAWWSGKYKRVKVDDVAMTGKMVILSTSMPLGWAVKLRDSFVHPIEMQHWGADFWDRYVKEVLKEERGAEGEVRHGKAIVAPIGIKDNLNEREGDSIRVYNEAYSERGLAEAGTGAYELSGWAREEQLEYEADMLSELVNGRSLLETELMALLSEHYPTLTEHWRSAAQLAHLKGRLKLEAAVMAGPPHPRAAAARRGDRQLSFAAGGLVWASAVARRLGWRGAARRRALPRCQRCGSAVTARTACAACGLSACAYCEACLALGRGRACALLLRSAALPSALLRSRAVPDPTAAARRWGLSAAQAEAAGAALGFMAEPRKRSADPCPERFLLWAVTGAGKTEMIFPLLEAVLAAGGRALVATPRRDVVLELAPRLTKAFPAETLAVLYGGSPDRWIGGRLALATTHQLVRFYQSFDLVIIDELDAYPYHNDPMLAHAAEQACKRDGTFIYLSATPPKELQQQVRKSQLAHARVPVRFHGHPLPVPKHLTIPPLFVCLKRRVLPKRLLQAISRSLARNAQIFMFVSRIAHIEPLLPILRRNLPGVVVAGTSSQDPARADKVKAFRNREISLLVTTTILERGVTIPRSDVIILDADNSLFDEASLVQMAGRAGRSKDDPAGIVVFASPHWSRPQRSAISQIRTMNRMAKRKGHLRKEPLL
ncbi:DEAD/DEAH box helicase [Paenibacillus wynnii]|uniref:DEAD/DEAH box helicase n=1 Tax=Paenibacillus wynnii TaxID=268407 RepID=UPI00278EF937|nr:helicase-related protein [Paenibacillus wynnii]MDQ0192192.1 late competence protein required for DNA uptake (superfamily II DNA/RNA helicase) [Paenibacillus wynnii]